MQPSWSDKDSGRESSYFGNLIIAGWLTNISLPLKYSRFSVKKAANYFYFYFYFFLSFPCNFTFVNKPREMNQWGA